MSKYFTTIDCIGCYKGRYYLSPCKQLTINYIFIDPDFKLNITPETELAENEMKKLDNNNYINLVFDTFDLAKKYYWEFFHSMSEITKQLENDK